MPISSEVEVVRLSLAEQAYHLLKSQILDACLAPGEKLDIFDLSEQLKISRTPVKEALNRLAREGLLEIRPQRGTFVAQLNRKDIEHVFDVRLMIELWAANKAIARPDSLNLARMSELLQKCGELLKSKDAFEFPLFSATDLDFHVEIVRAARNPRLLTIYESLNHQVPFARIFWKEIRDRAAKSQRDHLQILQAFQEGKGSEVRRALKNHITGSRNDMLKRLDQAQLSSC